MAEDLSRPAFRHSSSGRRPERLNQSRGVNAPLQLLRGWAAGTLGLPGDIEGLVRMLPGIKDETPVLPTSDFYREWLPGYDERPAARAMSGLGALTGGMGATNVARAGLGAVKRATDVNAIRDYVRAAQGVSGMPGTAVIKPKGGNWLAGAQSPEASVERLKVRPDPPYMPYNQEELQQAAARGFGPRDPETGLMPAPVSAENAALNRWIDKKLSGYIRNEMATPEDPVRALAERGVLHFEPQNVFLPPDTAAARTAAGYPRHGVAKSPLATDWEVLADAPINLDRAGDLMRLTERSPTVSENPWLAKVPPETTVYSLEPGSTVRNENLGFGHLIDELRNAVNPESGLPRELLLKYSDLDKVTVPQAVQRVSDINQWRAAQKAEADLARAMNPATQVFKEYPEQGYRLVELRMPKDLPEGWKKRGKKLVGPNGELALEGSSSDPRYKILEDALKYEGETMGHCVGGYCPDVVEGRSRIFSLRDAKGQPHVTIETTPKGTRTVPEGDEDALVREAEDAAWSFKNDGDEREIEEIYEEIYDELLKERFPVSELDDIIQIKGKANKAPKEDYLPFVQDFVRSGQWGRVGDIGNTGLVDLSGMSGVPGHLKSGPRFMTQSDYDNEVRKLIQQQGGEPGFARGGAVSAPPGPAQYDPARIDALAAKLMAA
jgi:hypothetical protein